MSARPPVLARAFLWLTLPSTVVGASIAGDLEEEWSARPRGWARDVWFAGQALAIGLRYLPAGRLRANWGSAGLFRDLRAAVNGWRRSPLTVSLAIGALALGVGANTAVFSVLRGVVLAPLPYDHPGDLFRLWDGTVVSKAVFDRSTRDASAFTGLSAVYETRQTMVDNRGEPESLLGLAVTPSHFTVLGVRPALGRDFRPGESTPGNDRLVILSDGLWRRRFGADPSVIGRTIELGGQRTVIGVMGRRHEPVMGGITYWIPMVMDRSDLGDWANTAQLGVYGRRRRGVSAGAAQADLTRLATLVHDEAPVEYPDAWVREARATPLLASVVGQTGPTLWALQGAVLLVLLTGIANVTSLLLARGAGRRTEIAVRSALGASRGRITAQLASESVLVGLVAGAGGLAIAVAALGGLRSVLPGDTPRLEAIGLDPVVVAFAIALSIGAGLLSGIVPAFRLSHDGTSGIVRGRRSTGHRSAARLQLALVAAEIAFATLLATVTALVLQSGWNANRAPLGFEPRAVLTLRLRPSAARYPTDRARVAFFEQALARVRALPGVRSAGAVSLLPMQTTQPPSTVYRPVDRDPGAGGRTFAQMNLAFPGTLETLGIGLVRGRTLAPTDRDDAPPVVVVNEALARAAWGTTDVVGKELELFGGDTRYQVIGVAGDVRVVSPETPAAPAFYVAYPQAAWWPSLAIVARTETDPGGYGAAARAAVWEVDPTTPVEVAPLRSLVAESRANAILVGRLLLLFGGLALLLGLVGVYGVVAHLVSARHRELGIRLALGARGSRMIGQELARAAATAGLGVLIGLGGAVLAGRLYAKVLYRISPTDPLTLVGVAVALLVVALGAATGPARRAARIDPMQVLRSE